MKTETLLIAAAVGAAVYFFTRNSSTGQTPIEARSERRIVNADQVQSLREQLMKKIGTEFWDA